jgi:hypothetical protein
MGKLKKTMKIHVQNKQLETEIESLGSRGRVLTTQLKHPSNQTNTVLDMIPCTE